MNKRGPYNTKKIETVNINFRVPKVRAEACKDFVRPLLKEFLKKVAALPDGNV